MKGAGFAFGLFRHEWLLLVLCQKHYGFDRQRDYADRTAEKRKCSKHCEYDWVFTSLVGVSLHLYLVIFYRCNTNASKVDTRREY